MIDHLAGRPNPSWKRAQVFLVILFWSWRIAKGSAGPPRVLWLRKFNKILQRYTPWQIIITTLTTLYTIRNIDKILGLGSPEPLANLYSASYYRATWINTGLEAGFATAMSIRPKWLKDICSILFSAYYILYANEGDEKLRRFRAVPTVEMLRTVWEKTTNPYIRLVTNLPWLSVRRKILLSRPTSSSYNRPITAYLFFYPHESQLRNATDLILDFPGGGFVAMSPEHHEERLRMWAVSTGKPVLSIDYGKAPEYPYPFAIDEAYDTYRALVESGGRVIGMHGDRLNIIISGDSAGATLAVNIIFKLLELEYLPQTASKQRPPQPVALVLNYAALDFNFTSWMSPENLRVLRSEQSSGNLSGLELVEQKDHLQHISPLSMVKDDKFAAHPRKRLQRRGSWKDAIRGLASPSSKKTVHHKKDHDSYSKSNTTSDASHYGKSDQTDGEGNLADAESDDNGESDYRREEDRPLHARIRYKYPISSVSPSNHRQVFSAKQGNSQANKAAHHGDLTPASNQSRQPIGTRLTMTSRTGYFQDRVISPSMMRAMAILYIGPHRNPDFATDYHISPILAPEHLLSKFPPLLLQCGEKDPFVDDTVIFAGRVREAKRARKRELELTISGKSARFGEHLRMTNIDVSLDAEELLMAKKELEKLAGEAEDDWVQMVLFSEWSHGYLQMPALMTEAAAVIEELAGWMHKTFVRHSEGLDSHGGGYPQPGPVLAVSSSETETDDSGITFVPKKYQNGQPPSNRDHRMLDTNNPTAKGVGNNYRELPDDPEAFLSDQTLPPAQPSRKTVACTPFSPSTPEITLKSSPQRQPAGTQITETELFRRRRLLDSHIFEQ